VERGERKVDRGQWKVESEKIEGVKETEGFGK